MSFWDGKKVLVAGGGGFIGSHVVERLLACSRGARVTVADRLNARKRGNLAAVAKDIRLVSCDFLDAAACLKACRGQDVVLDLAARVAGVRFNAGHPATMLRDNVVIAANMIDAVRRGGAQRYLLVSSACVYPPDASVPIPESEGARGEPDPASVGYGWAKRLAERLGRLTRDEFGLKVAIARPNNVYGPRDHFESPDAHVVAALIRRTADGENPLVVWGNGRQRRAFLYVEDLARGLLDLTERHAEADPVNLASDEEVTVAELARHILTLSGSKAALRLDRSKPSGPPRRNCDSRKARRLIGFKPDVGLEEGLRRSIVWYNAHRRHA